MVFLFHHRGKLSSCELVIFPSHLHAIGLACSFRFFHHSLLPFGSMILVGHLLIHSVKVVHILRIVLWFVMF